eukprot:5440242-Prymnesium_polylepis.2
MRFARTCGSLAEAGSCAAAYSEAADGHFCGDRISWVMRLGLSQLAARARVAAEFPGPCGACTSAPTPTPSPSPINLV